MVPPTKNGTITSFFKRTSQPRPQTPSSPQRSVANSPSTAPLSSPIVPRSSIKVVIEASDDEANGLRDSQDGSASDGDELEDFMAKFDPRKSVAQTPPQKRFETPRSKRTMTELSSPLLGSDTRPQFLFDMKALVRDAQKDEATSTSCLKAKESREEGRSHRAASSMDKDEVFMSVVKDKDGQNAQKVLRAMKRAADSGPSRPRFCFFKSDYVPPAGPKPPKKIVSGPWRQLVQEDVPAREQFLASGLPATLAMKEKGLPEELFQWVLEDLCVNKSILVREEYCRILHRYPTHIKSLITPERLDQLFCKLGSLDSERSRQDILETPGYPEDPYAGRDWSNLRSFLELICLMAVSLSTTSVEHAIQTLLKMSMDKFLICNIDLVVEYERTIQTLFDILPAPSWNSFCSQTVKLLSTDFTINSIRLNSLLCLPLSNERARDFRRRLATAFFFKDPNLGNHEPSEIVTIQRCITRLKEDDFLVTRKTDFDELKANIIFLDAAIAGGSFSRFDNTESEKIFNQEIDELATMLAALTRKINDSGMKLARAEAKSVIEWVQKRISFSVRTKRQKKADIFEAAGKTEDASLPQQQAYMENFFRKA